MVECGTFWPPDADCPPCGKYWVGSGIRLLVCDSRCANRNHSLFCVIGPPTTTLASKL
jgi:hypothetical protein